MIRPIRAVRQTRKHMPNKREGETAEKAEMREEADKITGR